MQAFFKALIDRDKSFQEVASAARVYEDQAADLVAEVLAPELEEGEEMPDLRLLQRLARRALERRHRRLETAGENLQDQQVRVRVSREDLDGVTGAGHDVLAGLRLAFKGFFGKARSENFLGVRGETSRAPLPLGRQLNRAAARLLDDERELPAAKLAIKNFRRTDQARQLAARSAALSDAFKRWTAATKEADGLLVEKQRALEDYDGTFVKIAGWFAAFYQLAGREPWARGVRPSGHRKGRTIASLKIGRPRKKRARAPKAEAAAATPPPAPPAAAEPRSGPTAVLRPVPVEVVSEPAGLEIAAVTSRPARTRRPLPAIRRLLSFIGSRDRTD